MFAISTHDYAIASGERPPSPISTNEEREMFIKNQLKKRTLIEKAQKQIPTNQQNNLIIYIKSKYSCYVEQKIKVKILKKGEQIKNKKYKIYSPFDVDAIVYPEIWEGFNNKPFELVCKDCGTKLRNQKSYNYNQNCEICD